MENGNVSNMAGGLGLEKYRGPPVSKAIAGSAMGNPGRQVLPLWRRCDMLKDSDVREERGLVMAGLGARIARLRARNKRHGVLQRRKRNIWRKMRQRRGV